MPGPYTLADIATRLGGRVAGNPDVLISQVGSLEHAQPDQIAFLSNPRYRARLAGTRAGAVIVGASAETLTQLPRLVADNPYAAFARVSLLFNPPEAITPGIEPSAIVDARAHVDPSAWIGPGAVVEAGARVGARASIGAGSHVGRHAGVGDDCRLFPSVVIYHGCTLGARCVLHSGVVIGADGFGIAQDAGRWLKIPQIGAVRIGDDVEIGANTTIDRGAIDDTVIDDGVKLDNQIQIGHNCHVGAHTAMAGCVAVAGSARIGAHCTIGAAAVILGHLSIADHVHVSAGTVISRSIRKAGTYTGMFPFDDNASWARNTAHVRHLDELAARIRALEKKLGGRSDG
ncbi:MAG: UDP-3-O-(3-hydroxymyristoyl)glucosamine N-acyltransferase [Bradyrhizobium sp.]|uniref:UDP-3-O-(3-hydroxymyristoyl)glucosamine N-acyltransferase n=1 Tax=Bradyrhizobium sp. TaxID=376 RepID=UPI003D101852